MKTSDGFKLIARWRDRHGTGMKLMEREADGRPILFKQKLDRKYMPATILSDKRRANGGPIYTSRPTLAEAEKHAAANGFERVPS